MSRFTKLYAVALVVSLTFGGCYDPSGAHTTASLHLEPSTPAPVASRVEISQRNLELIVVATPMCAPSQRGHVERVVSDRTRRKWDSGKATKFMLMGAAFLAGGILLATQVPSLTPVAALLIPVGSIEFGVGFTNLVLPKERLDESKRERLTAVSLEGAESWQPCGEPEPAAMVTITMELRVGENVMTHEAKTDANGVASLPAEVDAWSASCNTEIEGWATLAGSSEVLKARAARSTGLYADESDSRLQSMHVEVGDDAGNRGSPPYTDLRFRIRVKVPSTNVSPSNASTFPAHFARTCLAATQADRDLKQAEVDRQKADARRSCIASKQTAARQQCRPSCVDTSRTKKCDIDLASCKMMFGEADTDCQTKHNSCTAEVGQDPRGIEACIDPCATKIYSQLCP